jgi:hypothetical protein
MKYLKTAVLAVSLGLVWGCAHMKNNGAMMFVDDVSFLKKYMDVVVLSDSSGQGKVCVVPALQGRVMTSSADGGKGPGYGWINYKHFEAGKLTPHINPYGGEDRFWMGPEGGQFSIFFPKGADFKFEQWATPACIDTEPFDVVMKSSSSVAFKKDVKLTNYSGTELSLRVDREIRVLEPSEAVKDLGLKPDKSVNMVAYQSRNTITNTGKKPWDKNSGMLSIWILGMYNPSPATTVVIPYNAGPESEMGPVVNDNYFGKVPAERLVVKPNAIYFSCDGKCRSKIGLPPKRAKAVLGSYDAMNKLLTVVQYNKPKDVDDYVNSAWELQKEPFKGDTVNSYNDGPNDAGSILGPFYEIESSSPAAALKPGASLTHMHRTIHFTGSEEGLDKVAKAVLGVSLEEIRNSFKK